MIVFLLGLQSGRLASEHCVQSGKPGKVGSEKTQCNEEDERGRGEVWSNYLSVKNAVFLPNPGLSYTFTKPANMDQQTLSVHFATLCPHLMLIWETIEDLSTKGRHFQNTSEYSSSSSGSNFLTTKSDLFLKTAQSWFTS